MPGIQHESFTLCCPSLKLVLHQKDDPFCQTGRLRIRSWSEFRWRLISFRGHLHLHVYLYALEYIGIKKL
ncbi:Uncharacterized protein HZ326_25271 [Fusarium oxysporum f. sp. albedinis]|nr:Uncharacterized protein HZ326_25271 [Fusarium oxysporum f. sp. albedinis]